MSVDSMNRYTLVFYTGRDGHRLEVARLPYVLAVSREVAEELGRTMVHVDWRAGPINHVEAVLDEPISYAGMAGVAKDM